MQIFLSNAFIEKYKIGAKKNGKIVALEAHYIGNAGAYTYLTPWVGLYATVSATGPYKIPNVKIKPKWF